MEGAFNKRAPSPSCEKGGMTMMIQRGKILLTAVFFAIAFVGTFTTDGQALDKKEMEKLNPCAAKALNPCAAKTLNPCAAKVLNPCCAKRLTAEEAKTINPCAAKSPTCQ